MNIIEQAARRLQELRSSGVEIAPATMRAPKADVARDVAVGRPNNQRPAAGLGHAAPRAAGVERALAGGKHVEIDLARLAAMGYVTPNNPRSQIANEFRVVKRPILNNVHNRGKTPVERANLIMVTSSVPGEGKTFVSVNLALSIAMERDTRVLLVDADVSRPSLLDRLGLPSGLGLLDISPESGHDIDELLMHTNIERLSILPAGSPSRHATELLASGQMERVLEDLSGRDADRVIVFDAPPLLPSTESHVLASRMGQVVLVVEAERTTGDTLTRALAMLETCQVVLPLLNKATKPDVAGYYNYYAPPTDKA